MKLSCNCGRTVVNLTSVSNSGMSPILSCGKVSRRKSMFTDGPLPNDRGEEHFELGSGVVHSSELLQMSVKDTHQYA